MLEQLLSAVVQLQFMGPEVNFHNWSQTPFLSGPLCLLEAPSPEALPAQPPTIVTPLILRKEASRIRTSSRMTDLLQSLKLMRDGPIRLPAFFCRQARRAGKS